MHDDQEPGPDPLLDAVVGELRRPVVPASAAADRTIGILRSERQRTWWPIAAALLLAFGLSLMRGRGESPRAIRFALQAPPAARVALIGDFNDWDPARSPLARGKGEWSATVRLKPGRYRYSFVVDGSRWVADPHGPSVNDDDFGTPTSVITVAR